MRINSFAIGLMILFAHSFSVESAELRLISAIPMTELMKELGPQFERATGHRLVVQYEVSGVFKQKIDAEVPFDIAISTSPVIDDLINEGKILAGTRTSVAYAGLGVGVRAGTPKPDIGSVEAFKRALLNSNSVAHSKEGQSGVYFKNLLERLGIAVSVR